MLRVTLLSFVAISLLVPGVVTGQEGHRVLVETLAMDVERRTVADLTQEEFQLTIGGKPMPLESFELLCPVGAAADPAMHKKDDPAPPPIAPGSPRKIVLAVDYNSLLPSDRLVVLDAIESMLRMSMTSGEEIMLVALVDGVRVEQRFTNDPRVIVPSLWRMKHDVTLWARDFGDDIDAKNYLDDIATLMDLLEGHDGAKAVVLFSTLLTKRDPNDLWLQDVAARPTTARTAIYPAWARGLHYGSVQRDAGTLQRLASETGGRPPVASGDLSLQYRRAQRDLSCRYVLGVRLGEEAVAATQPIQVRVRRTGVILRYPEQVRLFTSEQKRTSRLRATFIEPDEGENPLVRVSTFPMRPVDRLWQTLLTWQVPLRSDGDQGPMELTASLERGGRSVEQYRATIATPGAGDSRDGTRSATVTAGSSLKPGSYDLTFRLSRGDDEEIVSGQVRVEIPEVPKKGLFVKGPILTRDAVTALDEVFVSESSLKPLLVHEIDSSERFLAYWEACLVGSKDLPPEGSVVRRRFMTPDGVEAHALTPVPFVIEPKGPVRCVHAQDEVAPRTLQRGEYKLEVVIEKPGGEILASSSAPLIAY